MRIAIFGPGGIGGYFGARLAQAGEDVVFIARGEHLKAMRANGLKVDSVKGDFLVKPVQATDDPKQVGIVDMILLGVKAWQVTEAAQAMASMVGSHTFVLPLQNGLEAPDQVAAILGQGHVLGGLCGLITFIAGPGHIRHAGGDPFVKFGELDNSRSERIEHLYKMFTQAGINTEIPPNIQVALWMKFLFINPWSGVGAITRTPVGVWRNLPETRQMAKTIILEGMAVANTCRVPLPEDALEKTMSFFDMIPAQGTTSMHRDIVEGRPSELDALIGAVVRLGEKGNVRTPLHSFIYGSLLPLEMRARGQIQFAG